MDTGIVIDDVTDGEIYVMGRRLWSKLNDLVGIVEKEASGEALSTARYEFKALKNRALRLKNLSSVNGNTYPIVLSTEIVTMFSLLVMTPEEETELLRNVMDITVPGIIFTPRPFDQLRKDILGSNDVSQEMVTRLLNVERYVPYCPSEDCAVHNPRTTFTGRQFTCDCGWTSALPEQLVENYKLRWDIV